MSAAQKPVEGAKNHLQVGSETLARSVKVNSKFLQKLFCVYFCVSTCTCWASLCIVRPSTPHEPNLVLQWSAVKKIRIYCKRGRFKFEIDIQFVPLQSEVIFVCSYSYKGTMNRCCCLTKTYTFLGELIRVAIKAQNISC